MNSDFRRKRELETSKFLSLRISETGIGSMTVEFRDSFVSHYVLNIKELFIRSSGNRRYCNRSTVEKVDPKRIQSLDCGLETLKVNIYKTILQS